MVGIVALVLSLAYLESSTQFDTAATLNAQPPAESKLPVRRIYTSAPDPLAALPRELRAELTKASTMSTAEFSRRFVLPIDRLCRALELSGFGTFAVAPDPIIAEQRVCSGEVTSATQAAEASSVFVWVRSGEGRTINLIGVKLNLRDPGTAAAATSEVLNVLEVIHHALRWDLPDRVIAALRGMTTADGYEHFGVVYQFRREWSEVPRYNVIMEVRDRSAVVEARSFQPE